MKWDEVLRHHKCQHKLELVGIGVAGSVNVQHFVVDNIGAALIESVHHTFYRLFVTRNWRCRNNDSITTLNLDGTMFAISHTVKGSIFLTLCSGTNNKELIFREATHFLFRNKSVWWELNG